MILSSNTSSNSALVWTVTNSADVQRLNGIRERFDHAYPRWELPHITFIWPFMPRELFPEAHVRIRDQVLQVSTHRIINAGTVALDEIGTFPIGHGRVTVHLKSSDPLTLQELYKQIRLALPEVPVKRTEFHPHLTLGQCTTDELPKMEALIRKTLDLPLAYTVTSLQLLARQGTEPFAVVDTVALD